VNLPHRPLGGCVVNLSISEGDDSERLGFPLWQVNRLTLQLVAALFGQGASVVFGHDWREDGVMEAVYDFARQVQPPVPLSSAKTAEEGQPLLRNLLPWPDEPTLSEREREKLSSTLRVERAGLPKELQSVDGEARQAEPGNPLYRYVRARGLTFLRHRLNDACDVRLCLGGRRSDSGGRYPGIIEEAFLAVAAKKPLYLASFLGGATEQVVDAIEGKPMGDDFCRTTSLRDLYLTPPVKESDPATLDDRIVDRAVIWKRFAETGSKKVAATNGLTVEENDELLHTPVIDRVIELVLTGLSRRWPDLARDR
jgi:hypothetical protein